MTVSNNYTKLPSSSAKFPEMMTGFGVVTVMNAKVYAIDEKISFAQSADKIRDAYLDKTELARLDTLKIANVTVEGPSKTVMGGQYSNPLIKFGKSARIEMQDALGNMKAVEAFGGCINEYNPKLDGTNIQMTHITEDFAPARLIIGDSFFIDRKTGSQVPVDIIFYQVLPDSIFNLTQDAEGDATVFDLNGDLLTTVIKVPDEGGNEINHGVFYSILPHKDKDATPAIVVTDRTKSAFAVTGKGLEYSVNAGDSFKSTTDGSELRGDSAVVAGNVVQLRKVEKGVELARISVLVEE